MTAPIVPRVSEEVAQSTLRDLFSRHFASNKEPSTLLVDVPLRLCPLGAHSDHQGGTVTGFTIDRSLKILAKPRSDRIAQVFSTTFNQQCVVDFNLVPERQPDDWGNYLRGAVLALQARGYTMNMGFDAVLEGAMPIGGLSSSAAVSIAYLLVLQQLQGLNLGRDVLIDLVLSIENGYLGLQNGILDQSVILSSKPEELTCIRCTSKKIDTIALGKAAPDWGIMVVYSGLSRQLVATPFNQRVQECQDAATQLLTLAQKPVPEKPLLGVVGREVYDQFGNSLPDPLRRRAAHYFDEAARVERGMQAWGVGDIKTFGALVTASGKSSIENYESGSPALISLYEILADLPGVYGTRFCGGGFQGCCLALIDPTRGETIAEALHQAYVTRHPELAAAYSIHFCKSAGSPSIEVLHD